MKKKLSAKTRKPTARTQAPQATPPKPSLMARLWAEVHPKPERPIGHPIPPLTPTPIPGLREVSSLKSKVESPESKVQGLESKVQSPKSPV